MGSWFSKQVESFQYVPGTEQVVSFHIFTSTNKDIPITMSLDASLDDLKRHVQKEEGIFPEHQILTFNSNTLMDGFQTLGKYGIRENSYIKLVLRLA